MYAAASGAADPGVAAGEGTAGGRGRAVIGAAGIGGNRSSRTPAGPCGRPVPLDGSLQGPVQGSNEMRTFLAQRQPARLQSMPREEIAR